MDNISNIINTANAEGIILGMALASVLLVPKFLMYMGNWIAVMRGKPKPFPNGSEYLAAIKEVTELIKEVRQEIVTNQKEIRNAQIDAENKRDQARQEVKDMDQHVKNMYDGISRLEANSKVLIDRESRKGEKG